MEDYAAKMALKPDAALREYVSSYVQYREDAVLAALDELRRRGQPAPEDATLRPELEAVVQQNRAAEAATRQEAAPTEAALPLLYSPAGIIVMSATISVVAGAVLLALNMFRVRRRAAVVGLAAFVVAYVVGELVLVKWLTVQHLFSPMAALLLDLPIMLAYVWWFWPRYVATYQFQARNWMLPVAVGMILKIGLAYFLLHNTTIAPLMKQQMQQMQQ